MKKAMILMLALVFVYACGGGGGGGDSGDTEPQDQPLTPATMNQATAEIVIAMMLSSGDINDLSDDFADDTYRSASPDAQHSISLGAWVLERFQEGFLSGMVINEQDELRAGSGFESGNCTISGTYQISGTWTGPDMTDDICQISNVTMTMTYLNCREYGESITGTVTLSISGNMCSPTGMSIGFDGFVMTDSYTGIRVYSSNFDMTLTELEWYNDELTHAKVTYDGDIALNDLSMKFSQYIEVISISGSNRMITISGSITGSCLDGWVTFTTLSPMLVNDYNECPLGGRIELSGTSQIIVTFNSDGSLTIGNTIYSSCQNLPDNCQIISPTDTDLTGDWRGTWTDDTGASGEAFFSLSQTNNSVSGTVSVTGNDCLTTGNVSGTVSGNTANLTIQSGADRVALNATADNTAHTLTGTWYYTASDREECAGQTGNFRADLATGGADVHW